MTTQHKTFVDYYREDSDFRKKHLAKLSEKIECPCGFHTARANLSRHRKSHIHIEKMKRIDRIQELKDELMRLESE